jgi:hypothetical protein
MHAKQIAAVSMPGVVMQAQGTEVHALRIHQATYIAT